MILFQYTKLTRLDYATGTWIQSISVRTHLAGTRFMIPSRIEQLVGFYAEDYYD